MAEASTQLILVLAVQFSHYPLCPDIPSYCMSSLNLSFCTFHCPHHQLPNSIKGMGLIPRCLPVCGCMSLGCGCESRDCPHVYLSGCCPYLIAHQSCGSPTGGKRHTPHLISFWSAWAICSTSPDICFCPNLSLRQKGLCDANILLLIMFERLDHNKTVFTVG